VSFLQSGMDSSERDKLDSDRDERFLLNLTRMAGDTNAVFPDHMMEFVVYLTNENVRELVFIESAYTSIIFNDEEFNFPSCSIEVLHKLC
jgi:hypothetical protein